MIAKAADFGVVKDAHSGVPCGEENSSVYTLGLCLELLNTGDISHDQNCQAAKALV
jgi:hypothetical protein